MPACLVGKPLYLLGVPGTLGLGAAYLLGMPAYLLGMPALLLGMPGLLGLRAAHLLGAGSFGVPY